MCGEHSLSSLFGLPSAHNTGHNSQLFSQNPWLLHALCVNCNMVWSIMRDLFIPRLDHAVTALYVLTVINRLGSSFVATSCGSYWHWMLMSSALQYVNAQ